MRHRTGNTLSSLALAAVAAMAFIVTAPAAHAQYGYATPVPVPPPPLRYERRGLAPGPGYVWQEGYWIPDPDGDGHYRWQRGMWVVAPFAGAFYVHPHYDRYDGGYYLRPGFWSHENHEEREYYGHRDDHNDDHRDDHHHDDGH